MNIAIIGADGQLGSDIVEVLINGGHNISRLTRDKIEISDRDSVNSVINNNLNSELVINTAAFHHVEKCEQDPVTSFKVNGSGVANIAYACRKTGIPLMHISTDYVFDGIKREPYVESDIPNPVNIYGNSKLTGEYFISSIMDRFYILRLSGIYGKNICIEKGYNFVDKILSIGKEKGEVKVVDNEFLTPTFTEEIAEQILLMIKEEAEYGIYHISAEGQCSWFEFAEKIFQIKNPGVKVHKALPGEFSSGVQRPLYSVLENKHLKDQGLNIMSHWENGLVKFLGSYR